MQHLSLEDPRLTDFALGACSAAEQREVEAHLHGCEECRRLARGLGDTLARLPLGLPLQAAPPDETRGRLFASVDHLERFSPHAPALSDALAVPENDARLVLHRFSDDDGWRPAPVPGVTWRKAPVGAPRAGATAILARVEPGASFPRHKHLGDELTLVVQGAILDEHGRIDAGRVTARRDGSEHTITADPSLPTCLCAIVALGGIEFS